MRLQGKAAIVTGAGRGIGKAIARKFLQEGAGVFVCDVVGDRLEDARRELASLGTVHGEALFVRKDLLGQPTHRAKRGEVGEVGA